MSVVIPILKRTIFIIVTFVIPVAKRTIIIIVTVVISIIFSGLPLIFNFSAATAIGVHLVTVVTVVTLSLNLRNEVYYALLISGVTVTLIWNRLNNHDFDNIIVAAFAILLIFLGLSFDLRSLRKITIFVAIINMTIFATNSMPTSTFIPHFITQPSFTQPLFTQPFTILVVLFIGILVYNYEVMRYFLIIFVLFVFFLYTIPSGHPF